MRLHGVPIHLQTVSLICFSLKSCNIFGTRIFSQLDIAPFTPCKNNYKFEHKNIHANNNKNIDK